MRRLLLMAIMALPMCVKTACAGSYEDGEAAWKRGDYKAALKSLRLAAEQGSAAGQFRLGFAYDAGLIVPQDYAEAAKWYRLADNQGYPLAENSLGCLYREGQGVRQDYRLAVKWFRLAAEQGEDAGQLNLGLTYEYGHGMRQDYVRAHMWFNLAGAAGNTMGVGARDRVATRMTPQQIAEAQRLAR